MTLNLNGTGKKVMDELRLRATLTLPPYERPEALTVAQIKDIIAGSDLKHCRKVKQHNSDVIVFEGWRLIHSQDRTGVQLRITDGDNQSAFGVERLDCKGVGFFYINKAAALMALRWELTRKVMEQLAAVDALLEETIHAPSA